MNDAPTALDDAATTTEDSTVTVTNVLSNDSDPDTSDVLFVAAIDTAATNGSVGWDGTSPTFLYDPNGVYEQLGVGENSTDSFLVIVSDGNGGNDTSFVTVTIVGVHSCWLLFCRHLSHFLPGE